MKAILRYNSFYDGARVMKILAEYKVKILKTKESLCGYNVRITILVKDHDELMSILYKCNSQSLCEVRLIKCKPAICSKINSEPNN